MTLSSSTNMKLKTLRLDNKFIWAVITIIVLTCFNVAWSSTNSGDSADSVRCKKKTINFENPTDGVCGTVDIRSVVSNMRKLENCTIIEGNVHITLIEKAMNSDFENYTFPLLTEITGHLMLFRVHGLRSLKRIFPNLAIIRGQDLFYNYALIAYENTDLEEIGLVNLRTIVRGGVRITKNSKLCYVDTVDWSRIAIGAAPSEHNFMDNKDERAKCANFCPDNCTTTVVDNIRAKRCWTSHQCQKNLNCQCKDKTRACMDNGTCCHSYCLAGCSGPTANDCVGCKGVTYNNSCQPRCPPNTYMFSETRCLTDKECLHLRKSSLGMIYSKLLSAEKGGINKCVLEDCPPGYTVAEEGKLKGEECVKCKDFCPKECNGTEVNSIQDAQQLKGCSKIIGPLIIQVMGGKSVAQEMEENLGDIREITGYLNIRRSFALLTLYFLKKLEVIGGEMVAHQGHSLIVMDNVNLQELFSPGQKIRINHGKVAFHTNRRLCLYKINEFVATLNLAEKPTLHDISEATNGDLKPCAQHHMNLTVSKIDHTSAVLNWEKDSQDLRQLLTYNINFKIVSKDDDEDINIFLGRDACSDDVWMSKEQLPTDDHDSFQTSLLPNLVAFTKYAVFVQALTLTSATHSAMTNIITFHTKPYYPSEPLDLQVSPTTDPTELRVKWKPPKYPNGIVTHYKLVYVKEEFRPETFDQRNYCQEPIIQRKSKSKAKVEEEEKNNNVTGDCCSCPKSLAEQEKERDKRNLEVFFENHLHNNVYCQRFQSLPKAIDFSGISRQWRRMNKKGKKMKMNEMQNTTDSDKNGDPSYNSSTTDETRKYDSNIGTMEIYNVTETVIPNLEPFTEYAIQLQACQDSNPDPEKEVDQLCSIRARNVGWTKALWTKDLINETTILAELVTNMTGEVIIKWQSPPKPNGIVLNYNLVYKRNSQDNLVPTTVCINHQMYKKYKGYRLSGLDPGNWTYQINAVSLAGNSSFTKERFFVIPHVQDTDGKSKIFVVAAVIAFLLLLLLILLVVCVLVKHRFQNGDLTVISENMNYMPSSDLIDTMDGWEVDRDKIRILQPLGKGSFGMVYKGLAKGIRHDPDEELWVAVKTVNDRANFSDRREFLKEMTTMKAFDCYHVVKLLGVVSTGQPALVIMELMAKDLKNYLREHRPDELQPGISPPRIQDILQMAGEIADGMAYLASKKFVHRDLAARNCMVAEDATVKIGDFGMARDIYETDYYRKGGKGMLPVRWMAPESLRDGVFTTTSDVWSFGVVLWEMVTLAAQPYQGLSNEEVVKFISDGNTMAVPEQCPEQMEMLMKRCWKWKPRDRPSFINIIQYLEPYLHDAYKELSFYFTSGAHRSQADGGGGGGKLGSPPKLGGSGEASLSHKGASALSGKPDFVYQSSPHSGDENFCSNLSYQDSEDYVEKDDTSLSRPQQRRNTGSSYTDVREVEGSSELDESFEDGTDFVYNCDGGGVRVEGNDLRCFMGEEYQSVPSLMPVSNSSSLRDGGDHLHHHPSLSNQGLFELQPLISKDSSHSPPSATTASPHNLPSPNKNLQPPSSSSSSPHPPDPACVYPSDYIGYDPVHKGTDKNMNAPSYNSQLPPPHHQHNEPVSLIPHVATLPPDSDRLPSGSRSNPAWPSTTPPPPSLQSPPSSLSPSLAPTSTNPRPSLRLPVLNQPPGGGFRHNPRTPVDTAANRNTNTNLNVTPTQNSPCVAASHSPGDSPSDQTSSCNFVNEEENIPLPLPAPSNHPSSSPPPPGAIDSLSSDGSKESTKSSGSHSLMNGLTNGHAPTPSSSIQHRTALC